MIFANDVPGRRLALEKLLPAQRGDFEKLFSIMQGLPVTIRLLDPPLHEFLPQTDEDVAHFARAAGMEAKAVHRRLSDLHETNPMLGHRGCRLGITFPEIYEMQVRAILEAALANGNVTPEIMIPLVAGPKEFVILKTLTHRVAEDLFEARGKRIEYIVGTMIELPRAALTADEIAKDAEFFSFGTNDLTQTTLGLSRDDSASFLSDYIRQGIFERDPFASIDQDGVGQLVKIACEKGRNARKNLKLGICGEHGGDPASIAFFEQVGLDYVSCSPYRVPVARLAAAQASIRLNKKNFVRDKKKEAA
jgi:pyruvate, orthophosphate dikinase